MKRCSETFSETVSENAGDGPESLCRAIDIMRQVSTTVVENSLILANLSQSLFYRFSDTVSENLNIAKKGPPLMKEMRLVFLHYWTGCASEKFAATVAAIA